MKIISLLPGLHQTCALDVVPPSSLLGGDVSARSGAAVALLLSGGGTVSDPSLSESLLGVSVSPQGKAAAFMALAMACHYLGYSIARSVSIALFTSESTGYKSAAAFPLTMAFISPVSLLLLVFYNGVLDKLGPGGALTVSTTFCSTVLSISALLIAFFQKVDMKLGGVSATKYVTAPLLIFREAYVQLITSQYWSFMASVLTPNQSAKWFAPIAGLTSIAGIIGGMAVTPLMKRLGLTRSLLATAVMLLISLLGSRSAYQVADKYGFTPKRNDSKPGKGKHVQHEPNIFKRAVTLFKDVPVLRALFVEILSSQSLATLLNVCFVAKLGVALPDDQQRAGWVAIFYALINLLTMMLQFGILPRLMTVIEPKDLWRAIPLLSILFTGNQLLRSDPSLYIVSASLLVMKVSEYSARRMLDEMVYVPLSFESRYVGKEIIGVLGGRLGKSAMSLTLSGVTAVMGDFNIRQLSALCNVSALIWLRAAWDLSNLVPTRAEAEEAFQNSKKRR